MPRQNREEIDAELARAKLEGFRECRALVARLADAGLSLKVANYALGEQQEVLEAQRDEAREKAQATRAPAPSPKRPRKPRAVAEPALPPTPEQAPTAAPEGLTLEEFSPGPTALPAQSIPDDPSSESEPLL